MKRILLLILGLCLLVFSASAQTELAATLEVLESGVTVQRVNTANPIEIRFEAIVGVGDTISTDESGRARITFFADGTSTELEPNTVYRIEEFNAEDESFTLRVTVVAGRTVQQLGRVLDASSTYEVETPGMTMAARGTIFAIRVEDNGRSAMLVSEGTVATDNEAGTATVPSDFGIRAEVGGTLSDVVRASSFDELDSALDGCTVVISTPDDVSLNLRLAPSVDAPLVGYLTAESVSIALGKNESGGWYRVAYVDSFAWFLSSSADVNDACAGLRVFPDDFSEDPDAYNPSAVVETPEAESTEAP